LPSSVANAISILICGTSRAIELRGKKCRCVGTQPFFFDKIRVGINAKYKEIAERDNDVTAEKVKNAFLGLEMRHETLLKVFAQNNEDFFKQVDASLRSPSTYHKYSTVYKHLEELIKTRYHVSDIALKELTPAFITDFDIFLRTEKQCCNNTVWIYMMPLRRMITIAQNHG
jgi:putative bacteriophage integrase